MTTLNTYLLSRCSRGLLWMFSLAVMASVGCDSGSKDKLVPVTGTITQNGAPLAGANVTFMPKEALGAPSGGQTDASGHFELQYNDGRAGAVPGAHRVIISLPGPEAPEPTGGEQQQPPQQQESPEFHKEVDVTDSGQNEFTLEVATEKQ